jgi:hypothetical protein
MLSTLAALSASAGPGCQSASSSASAVAEPAPHAIELHDASGKITAKVVPGHPCRATVDDIELLVGTDPLVAQLGDVRWSGDVAANGTTFRRNDEPIARMYPSDQPMTTGLYSADGSAIFRATAADTKADLVSAAGAIFATVTRAGGKLAVGDRTVTGTDDLLLAALLAAPTAPPEVRGLAACHRLFPPAKAVP